jgi:hypothetical protein
MTESMLRLLVKATMANDGRVWAADVAGGAAASSAFWRTGTALAKRGFFQQIRSSRDKSLMDGFEVTPSGTSWVLATW